MGDWRRFLYVVSVANCFASVFCGLHTDVEWSYTNMTEWSHIFPKCGGDIQSPINIVDDEAVRVDKPAELHFHSYNAPIDDVELENNGKTARFDHLASRNITLTGRGMYLDGNFTLAQVHFHWGNDDDTGSEHRINGKGSPLEVHFVHFNLEKYSSIKEASENSDGVLVLSVLAEASKNATFNSIWKKIGDRLDLIHIPGTKTKLEKLELRSIVPQNVRDYYMYRGSFTTPPCFQSVTWIVLREKVQIFDEHLESFRALQTSYHKTKLRLASNIRPVQPLNSRAVLKTFDSPEKKKLTYITEKVINGHEVISALKFYPCHLPPSVSLSVIIPSQNIYWKSKNLTTDLKSPTVLDSKNSYDVTMEMHEHPRGLYRDNVHVTVQLRDSPTVKPIDFIEDYYMISKECFTGSCMWSTPGKRHTCLLQLIDSDEALSFTLVQHDSCDYKLVIKKQQDVIFATTLSHNERVQLKPTGVDKTLSLSLSKWYCVLYVNRTAKVNKVKMFLEIPETVLTRKVLLMQGDYNKESNCNSKDGFPSHVKLIVGVAIGIFLLAMIVLIVVLVVKKSTRKHRPNLLVDELQLDLAKV